MGGVKWKRMMKMARRVRIPVSAGKLRLAGGDCCRSGGAGLRRLLDLSFQKARGSHGSSLRIRCGSVYCI